MSKTTLSDQINEQIGEFDLISLLRLLKHKGYKEEHIRFDSHTSQTSQDRVIREVVITGQHVLIIVDLGLLGIHTPLPSVMIREVKVEIGQGTPADKLLDMLDHSLLLNYISNIYPEINTQFFPQWHQTKKQLLLLQNTHSISTLYWIFEQVFPEFNIAFGEKKTEQLINAMPIILNQSSLDGKSHFGGVIVDESLCIHISLHLKHEHYRSNIIWVQEVEKRLESLICPLLNKREIYLIVSLRLEYRQKALQLAPTSLLGREGMYDDFDQEELPSEVFYPALHQGAINLATPDTDYIIRWGEPCRIHI